jgi:hypothetical protein
MEGVKKYNGNNVAKFFGQKLTPEELEASTS